MKLFSICYDLYQLCEQKIKMDDSFKSFKKRAFWALLGGFARAGVFWFS